MERPKNPSVLTRHLRPGLKMAGAYLAVLLLIAGAVWYRAGTDGLISLVALTAFPFAVVLLLAVGGWLLSRLNRREASRIS